jgi:hypothetical protein
MRRLAEITTIYIALLLTACATVGNEALRDVPSDWPRPGTPRTEIYGRLGAPTATTTTMVDDTIHETAAYTYAHVETSPFLWVPIIGLFVALSGEGVQTETKSLILEFDPTGKLVKRSTSTTYSHPR